MHDLRQKVLLQSGKTVSRKQRSHAESSRTSSVNHTPNTSPGGSRVNSRPASHAGSDNEDEYDDVMTRSTMSDDGEDEHTASGKHVAAWPDRLRDRIDALLDSKRSSVQGRAGTLKAYTHLLKHHYAAQVISPHAAALISAISNSISGKSDEEKINALRALSVTILTCPANEFPQLRAPYEKVCRTLEDRCRDTDGELVKVEVIRALGTYALYGGGSSDEASQFFLGIVQTDGDTVDALDSGAVVSAAMEAWAFVASYTSDLHELADEALEAFTDQLEAGDPDVQASAAFNIALLFEAVRRDDEETEAEKPSFQHEHHVAMEKLEQIEGDSSRSVSRKERKDLRSTIRSVMTSLELHKGPGYSTAIRQAANPNKGSGGIKGGEKHSDRQFHEYGSREKVRIGDQLVTIESWAVKARVDMLKTLLEGGFGEHFMKNPLLEEILEDAKVEGVANAASRKSKRGGDEEGFSKKPPKYLAETY